jgi:hypothetical protein
MPIGDGVRAGAAVAVPGHGLEEGRPTEGEAADRSASDGQVEPAAASLLHQRRIVAPDGRSGVVAAVGGEPLVDQLVRSLAADGMPGHGLEEVVTPQRECLDRGHR